MGETSGGHLEASGGIWEGYLQTPGSIWEASGDIWRHLKLSGSSWRHLGSIPEAFGRHLENVWEAAGRRLGGDTTIS